MKEFSVGQLVVSKQTVLHSINEGRASVQAQKISKIIEDADGYKYSCTNNPGMFLEANNLLPLKDVQEFAFDAIAARMKIVSRWNLKEEG